MCHSIVSCIIQLYHVSFSCIKYHSVVSYHSSVLCIISVVSCIIQLYHVSGITQLPALESNKIPRLFPDKISFFTDQNSMSQRPPHSPTAVLSSHFFTFQLVIHRLKQLHLVHYIYFHKSSIYIITKSYSKISKMESFPDIIYVRVGI